jgi:hypothetical protein
MNIKHRLLGAGFALAVFAATGAASGGAAATPAAAACANPLHATMADTANPLTARFLKAVRAKGVTTIARYYDYPDETLPGKTLTVAERALVAARGMALVVVFQHHNDQLASFTPERGAADAARALELAGLMHQPAGSAVYFGVDGSWSAAADQAKVLAYFRAVRTGLAGSNYRVGVYGNGLTCKSVIAAGQASLCWLANPKGWPGYQAMIASGGWSVRQGSQTLCGGTYVDFDRINPARSDVGQFKP